jgi:hypothetical protein
MKRRRKLKWHWDISSDIRRKPRLKWSVLYKIWHLGNVFAHEYIISYDMGMYSSGKNIGVNWYHKLSTRRSITRMLFRKRRCGKRKDIRVHI